MRRPGRVASGGTALLILSFLAGPRVRVSDAWEEPDLPVDVSAHVERSEALIPSVRSGDQKQIVWAEPERRLPTALAVVYLHGFSADRHEVEPLVSQLSERLGANLYFARLRGHGRDGSAMGEARAEDWLEDALEAVQIGGRIGDRVLLVGTSTGATLALWAAGQPKAREQIAALLLISPNLQPKDRSSRLLLWPWGALVARVVVGPQRCFEAENEEQERHWTTCYPTSALLPMMALVEHVRTSDLSRVEAPAFVAYSPDDQVVDPREIERLFPTLGSSVKELHVVEGGGDPAGHILAGDILSPATTGEMLSEMLAFVRALDAPR